VGSVQHELVLVRKIPVISANDYAILFIGINGNYLKSRINTSPLITEVTVNDDPIFYSTNYSHVNQEMGYPIDYDQRYYTYNGIVDYDGEDVVLQLSTLSMVRSQDKLYIATIDNEAIANTNRITRVSALIVLISLLVPFIMVSIFTKTLSARIKTLRQEMHKVSTGDLNIIEDFKGNDELVDLYSDLKIMIAGIKRMDEEIYTERITKQEMINHQQEMQLEMLASKINPHFLFNTLETIRMKAYSAGDKEVATAIKLLGKSMRHVLETGGRMVSLKSELEYIAVYLDIQKLRFKDKINYDIVVGEDINTEEYKILPLLLQPVVENAFIHGLEDKEKDGYIRIDIKSEDNQMVVTVSDNGIGMDDEQLTVLLERIKLQNREDHSKSIGLHNVYQRIRLFYGDAYGMDIKSVKNKGTEVYIRLPVKYSADTSGKIS
jgi:two-component system sensor histidine kinase YesM